MDLTQKLKIAMVKTNTSQIKLAELTAQSQNNLSAKMQRNDFKLSEYEKLVNALGGTLNVEIELPTGEKI